jgi:hypothetical protein
MLIKINTRKYPNYLFKIQALNDPFILDIRSSKDEELKENYKYDYKWFNEFRNRGITKIILRKPELGKVKLKQVIKKAKEFRRDIVILHEDEAHCEVVGGLINESGYA